MNNFYLVISGNNIIACKIFTHIYTNPWLSLDFWPRVQGSSPLLQHHWLPLTLSWFMMIMIYTLNTFLEWIMSLSLTHDCRLRRTCHAPPDHTVRIADISCRTSSDSESYWAGKLTDHLHQNLKVTGVDSELEARSLQYRDWDPFKLGLSGTVTCPATVTCQSNTIWHPQNCEIG
jgi:hypothetical protein